MAVKGVPSSACSLISFNATVLPVNLQDIYTYVNETTKTRNIISRAFNKLSAGYEVAEQLVFTTWDYLVHH